MIQMTKPPSIYMGPWGHNIILADLTIITIWGLHGYNNNKKGATLIKIRDYTSNMGT